MSFRYRALSQPDLDMMFGQGNQNFHIDSAVGVAQSVYTRLLLLEGEWFLDLRDGTPWLQTILGKPTEGGNPDVAIRERILETPYVRQMYDYASGYDSATRSWAVSCKLVTEFGPISFATALEPPAYDNARADAQLALRNRG